VNGIYLHFSVVSDVGGNTVTNPFMVTEVYIKENGKWKMGSLTFFHLLRPVKIDSNITGNIEISSLFLNK
jgi:hypothetical protein